MTCNSLCLDLLRAKPMSPSVSSLPSPSVSHQGGKEEHVLVRGEIASVIHVGLSVLYQQLKKPLLGLKCPVVKQRSLYHMDYA